MIIQSYTDCIHLFKFLAFSDPDVRDFYVGEDKRLLDASRSDIQYPFVWVEYADGKTFDPRGNGVMYETRIFVVSNALPDNPASQEVVLEEGEEIVKRLLWRLRNMAQAGQIIFDLDRSKWMRVRMAQLDSNWGWEIRLEVGSYLQTKPVCDEDLFDVRIFTPVCNDTVGFLVLGINSILYTEPWNGSCDTLPGVLSRLADQIPETTDVFGNYLTVRSASANTPLLSDTNQGDFSWEIQLPNLTI